MTPTELKEHLLVVLIDNKDHTIVKHINPSGKECYRIRDKFVNPIANMPESIFKEFVENGLITKINDREWQLKPLFQNHQQKKSNTCEK